MDEQEKILETARNLYLQYGIKSITMDDVARHLGMSKKTLYQYVENKEDLVHQVMGNFIEKEKAFVREQFSDQTNAIDDLLQINQFFSTHLSKMNPTIKYDLQKYYPKTWELFQEYKDEFIYNVIYNNIEKGIEQSIYRKGVPAEMIAKIYVERLEACIDPRVFPPDRYHVLEIIEVMQEYHIRGIASRFGIKFLEDRLKNQKESS